MSSFIRNLFPRCCYLFYKQDQTKLLRHIRVYSCQYSSSSEMKTIQQIRTNLVDLMGIEKGYRPIQKPRNHLLQSLPKTQDEIPTRTMNDSFDSAVIPLSTDADLQEKYITFLGHVRLGRLMEDMDLFAGHLSYKHVHFPSTSRSPTPVNIVTISVDEIMFESNIVQPNADIRLSGHVCWVGKSSLEVVVWLEQEVHGSWQKITRALFLMAARNATNTGPAVVNKLASTNDKEAEILKGGEDRKRRRQLIVDKDLLKTIPTTQEQQVVHNLFLKTVDPKNLTLNRKVLPPFSIWMKDAQLHNTVFCHPEDRNLHNKIFGGFLMRQALELAWSAGYLYSKHRPQLLHISDIRFHNAVDVGSMLNMYSVVSYTEQNYIQIAVSADVYNPQSGQQTTTNIFHYTFESAEPVPQIIPKTYHEAMMYVDGRRHFQHVMGLTSQSYD